MARIDFYVQHLLRHKAQAVELTSGEAVLFHFPSGNRRTNTKVDHAQVTQLVQEAADPAAMSSLRSAGATMFRHRSAEGAEVEVSIEERGPGSWRVLIRPATADTQQPGAQPPPPPAPQPGPAVNARQGGPAEAAGATAAAEDAGAVRREQARRSAPPQPSSVKLAPGEPRINRYLRMMAQLGASDLHLSAGVKPLARIHGEVQSIGEDHPLESDELEAMFREIMLDRNREQFSETNDTDFAHMIEDVGRFRANVFRDRRGVGGVFRMIPFEILTPEQLGLPSQVLDLCWLSKGLVVVTGPTGSGKSTTLATLIDYINQNRTDHIITIEDPIEFTHDNKKCLVNQREVGVHTQSFKNALRAALREDPDIVLVGEMRDLETIAIAIETAETGHLVFGTLHTTTAASTVDRIIDQFPPDQQAQIRVMLSESLKGVIAQVLCKKKGGGRSAAYEIMIANSAVANLIREGKTYQLASVMQTGKNLGMQTMNDHLLEHVRAGRVSAEEAYIKTNSKLQLKEAFNRLNIPLNL